MAKELRTQPPEWIQEAPVRVIAARELAATPAEIFDALCDHESWPEWFTSLQRVERIGDQREGVGSRRRVSLSKRLVFDEEFNVWDPGKAWGFTVFEASTKAFRTLNELVEIQAISDDRTRITYTMGFDPNPIVGFLMKIGVKGLIKKNLSEALENLGAHIINRREG